MSNLTAADIAVLTPELAAAFRALDLITPGQLALLGLEWLEQGLDTYTLRILAGEDSSDRASMPDIGPLFERALHELGVSMPEKQVAAWQVARYYARQITEGHLSPQDGADRIWRDAYDFLDEPTPTITALIGEASEYDDFIEGSNPGYHSAEECARIYAKIDARIRDLAAQLLEKGSPDA